MEEESDSWAMHLAGLNIARLKRSLDDPRVAELVRNLERVNASERAFGWAQLVDIERWRAQRCA